jgi:hypothetical protein
MNVPTWVSSRRSSRVPLPHLLEFLLLADQEKEVLENLDGGGLDGLIPEGIVVEDFLD